MSRCNILFLCQHNVFRSQVAEAYFNQINTIPEGRATSAGLFPHHQLEPEQVEIARELDVYYMTGQPKGVTTETLGKQDLIIIVADAIPASIIARNVYDGPIEKWTVRDEPTEHGYRTKGIITEIKNRVIDLQRGLLAKYHNIDERDLR